MLVMSICETDMNSSSNKKLEVGQSHIHKQRNESLAGCLDKMLVNFILKYNT